MTTSDLLGGPLGEAVGLALLHALWQGAIVAGALAAILALLSRRSAALRYGVACAALALLFVMVVMTGVYLYTPAAIDTGAPIAGAAAAPSIDDTVFIAASTSPLSWHDNWLTAVAVVRGYIPQIVILWFLGVFVLTLRLAASWTRTRALANRGAVAADETWQRTAARLSGAMGLRTAVRLVVSGGVDVPSVVGWLKPAILLPVSSFTGLTAEQLEMVLAHELAHIRRHDFLINAMQSVIETLLFYHPAVWYLSRQIRIERENCCDDLAVSVCGDAILYARALAQLEELRATPLLAVAANGGSLLDRIRRLVGPRSERSLFSSGWTAAAAMASFVALLTLSTAPMFAGRQAAPPQTPQPATARVDVRAPEAPEAPAQKEMTKDEDTADDGEDAMDEAVVPEPPEPPETPELPMLATPAAAPRAMALPRVRVAPRVHIAPRAIAAIADGVAGGLLGAFELDEGGDQPSTTPPGKLSVDELIALRVQGVTPEYIQQMQSVFPKASLHDIISMKVQGITPDYVAKMRATGLPDLSARDIIGLRVQGVTPDYISGMRSAGVNIKTAREAMSLKVQGVTVDFVRQLAAAGYEHLTPREIARLAASGVNADFIREMSKYKKDQK